MKRSLRILVQVLLCAGSLIILGGWQNDRESGMELSAGRADSSLIDTGTLSVTFAILNRGNADVSDVQATAISLQSGSLTEPETLPLAIGAIPANSNVSIDATFKGRFSDGKSYPMKVEGTFKEEGATHKFAIEQQVPVPPTSPGSATSAAASSPANNVDGATYPPQSPNIDDEINPDYGFSVPNGPNRPSLPPPQETTLEPAPKPAPVEDPPVNFFASVNVGVTENRTTLEPSGAVAGKVIFVSYNSKANYSTDGGSTFTELDPTAIFPDADGHFCCDQVVQYAASIDRVIWILLYRKGANGENRFRIAAASPKQIEDYKGKKWTFWDVTSAKLKHHGSWLDFPDTSIGDSSLYISIDVVGAGGLVVVRVPLSEVKSASTIHYRYTHADNGKKAWAGHLAQNARDEIFWAGHKNNTTLLVFSWKEGSNIYRWRDVKIHKWPKGTLSSLTPDHQDWLTKAHNHAGIIRGATRLTAKKDSHEPVDQLWFGWTASSGSGFKQSHIEWVSLDVGNHFNVIHQSEVWNDKQAFAYPAFSSNSDGELGMSLEMGGGGEFENHACGFWGDFKVFITTTSDEGVTRFGDCVSIRQDAAHPRRFDAFGYGVHKTGTTAETRYMQFGRPSN
jgi:hypothetical protein